LRVKYRALISDLDGTLLDTLEDLADSVNAALARLGLPQHELDAYRYFVGDGRRALALRALPEDRREQATLDPMIAYIGEEYEKRWMDRSQPYEGIPELLDALTALGVRMAILSNKPHSYTEATVSRLLPNWSFELVLGESPSTPRKPDPSGALQIMERMGIEPGECLYIGDSGVDMQTATAAGLYAVGVLWGFRTADELLSNGARVLVEKPADIIPLFSD
jgi:phosphoglycolate phosphatase